MSYADSHLFETKPNLRLILALRSFYAQANAPAAAPPGLAISRAPLCAHIETRAGAQEPC